ATPKRRFSNRDRASPTSDISAIGFSQACARVETHNRRLHLTELISEGARLQMDIPALPAGNSQYPLPLGSYDDCSLGNPAAAKAAGRSCRDDMFAQGNKNFDLFRWRKIGDRQGADEYPNGASRSHETAVTLDNQAPGVLSLG
ncbi:MAG TPA: hypothetical protein VFQ89_06490, partial [Candidatus Binatia bacterium]|nr:hypothetical protein [Candidatus Binatia bacterium]